MLPEAYISSVWMEKGAGLGPVIAAIASGVGCATLLRGGVHGWSFLDLFPCLGFPSGARIIVDNIVLYNSCIQRNSIRYRE